MSQQKIWQKKSASNQEHAKKVEAFTVGDDTKFDLKLAKYDVLGSLAHCEMLCSINLLTEHEWQLIKIELHQILNSIENGTFKIDDGVEDVHSQVEYLLTQEIGDVGKKIHSGRSRNDQVLTDLKLFFKSEILEIKELVVQLFKQLIQLSEQHKDDLLPGYTHLQVAMPSSFGLWFGAYAESLIDDMEMLLAAYNIVNKNPLGSGAGYGSSFPLNRTLTTKLLGFKTMNTNVVYAQMTRGKSEKAVATATAALAATLSKFSLDTCLYMSQNFGFITFPDTLTTGSSIMPHKKNPDVFEIMRAKCNILQSLPNQLTLLINNLPSGYHRDVQLTKESLFPALETIKECLGMLHFMLQHIEVKTAIVNNDLYKYMFSVESVNKLVLEGVPFRDAYIKVGLDIEAETFEPNYQIKHSHEGSIGNLCNEQIEAEMSAIIAKFN